ncbi:hypothetical protein BC938DRAFT_474111 [Jimgerdemannia flammicorona]|uniref:Uncharacterized protein n=1 Tax=Jimgerdemannia flammicorona TaxID=994334 RepID=A0A433QSS7_9FUNG|nr:hypothetical protein BC938DRAFT_474111 [Jimgerdemannia flammicorona]
MDQKPNTELSAFNMAENITFQNMTEEQRKPFNRTEMLYAEKEAKRRQLGEPTPAIRAREIQAGRHGILDAVPPNADQQKRRDLGDGRGAVQAPRAPSRGHAHGPHVRRQGAGAGGGCVPAELAEHAHGQERRRRHRGRDWRGPQGQPVDHRRHPDHRRELQDRPLPVRTRRIAYLRGLLLRR